MLSAKILGVYRSAHDFRIAMAVDRLLVDQPGGFFKRFGRDDKIGCTEVFAKVIQTCCARNGMDMVALSQQPGKSQFCRFEAGGGGQGIKGVDQLEVFGPIVLRKARM